jgi:hypothetical protein
MAIDLNRNWMCSPYGARDLLYILFLPTFCPYGTMRHYVVRSGTHVLILRAMKMRLLGVYRRKCPDKARVNCRPGCQMPVTDREL